MNCPQTIPTFDEDDVPPNLRPFIDALLNENCVGNPDSVPPICRQDVDEQSRKVKDGGSDGTRTRGLLRDRQAF